jgi:hypothetical protein
LKSLHYAEEDNESELQESLNNQQNDSTEAEDEIKNKKSDIQETLLPYYYVMCKSVRSRFFPELFANGLFLQSLY